MHRLYREQGHNDHIQSPKHTSEESTGEDKTSHSTKRRYSNKYIHSWNCFLSNSRFKVSNSMIYAIHKGQLLKYCILIKNVSKAENLHIKQSHVILSISIMWYNDLKICPIYLDFLRHSIVACVWHPPLDGNLYNRTFLPYFNNSSS